VLECAGAEGVRLATKRHCKFVEVSALLDQKVDEDELFGLRRASDPTATDSR